MAPSLIDENYSKQLNEMSSLADGKAILQTFHFATHYGDVVRFVEKCVNSSEYDTFLEVYLLPSYNPEFQLDEIERVMDDEGANSFEAAEHIIKIGIVDATPDEPQMIGRFAYKDFSFIGGDGSDYIGKQIRGAYLEPPYNAARIGSTAYSFILDKYGHLICDNFQTVLGASMWSGTMRKFGDVMIYDTVNKCIVDKLGDRAKGINTGFQPWDIGNLSTTRLANEWGDRELCYEKGSRTNIVHIISRQ
ncbi:hypothetical protein AB7O25_02685 [Escherichia coli]|uniref:hypothetical protein n=1 Tax=Escherichia coli TaxID=562 RepID=UPI00372D5AC3